jgi:DNA polymerase-1
MLQGTVVILDMKGLIMHSYFRAKDPEPLFDAQGEKITTARAAISTFLRSYWEEITSYAAPFNIVAVWDGGHEYRKRLFPGYKKKRHEQERNLMQEAELERAYRAIKGILAYCGSINVSAKTVEGDDLIALISEGLPNNQIIYTVDYDLLQLHKQEEGRGVLVKIADQVRECYVLKPSDKSWELEVPPEYITMLKALVGDSSDEYPGVPGVGPVAFKYLVQNYGWDGLDEIRECILTKNWEPIREAAASNQCKVLNKILENTDKLSLCYQLAILHPECCYGFTGQKQIKPEVYKGIPNREKLFSALSSVQCGWMMEDYFEKFMPVYTLVTETNFDQCFQDMQRQAEFAPFISFDHETYNSLNHEGFLLALPRNRRGEGYIDVLSQKLTGTSFCVGESCQNVYYFSVEHRSTLNISREQMKKVYDWLYACGKQPVAHNAGFEVQVLHNEYDVWYSPTMDTVAMSSSYDENLDKGLKDLSSHLFRYTQTTYKELLEQCGAADMRDVTGEEVLNYGCDDSMVTSHLVQVFYLTMCMEKTWEFFQKNDVLTTDVFAKSFEKGCNIDLQKVEIFTERDRKLIDENNLFLRKCLLEHCNEMQPKHAQAYFEAERDFFIAEMQEADPKVTRSHLLSRLEEKRLSFIEKTVYVPYTEEFIPAPFAPTPAQLNDVIFPLGFDLELTKATNKEIDAWLASQGNMFPPQPLTSAQETFISLLTEVMNKKQFKGRKGEAYDAFEAFCRTHRKSKGKVVESGDELNLGSPKQMQELFYLKLGLPVRVRNDTEKGSMRSKFGLDGSPSTNEEAVMTALAEDCPEGDWRREFLQKYLEVKSANTRFALYWTPYPHWVHPRDGMIHPGIKNSSTVTRRPAGTSPNILQVEKGPTREIYIPRYRDKQIIVCIDFNGQELRLTGSEARDPVLIDCYTGLGSYIDEDGMHRQKIRDVHSVTGCGFAQKILARSVKPEVMNLLRFDSHGVMDYQQFYSIVKHDAVQIDCAPEVLEQIQDVIGTVRQYAKVVNFLLIYGGNEYTLSQKLGLPKEFCLELLEGVFAKYPRLRPWQEETSVLAAKQGYVLTAYGNRRHLNEDVKSNDSSTRNRILRQAGNATIQSTAADILKIVMSEIERTRLLEETKSVLHAPVYDEIFSSVHIDHVFEYCQRVQDIMNLTPPGHAIPMMGEVGIGLNWAQCKQVELKDRPSQRKIEEAMIKMLKEQKAA